jgi:hypothetical protein
MHALLTPLPVLLLRRLRRQLLRLGRLLLLLRGRRRRLLQPQSGGRRGAVQLVQGQQLLRLLLQLLELRWLLVAPRGAVQLLRQQLHVAVLSHHLHVQQL